MHVKCAILNLVWGNQSYILKYAYLLREVERLDLDCYNIIVFPVYVAIVMLTPHIF